MSSSVADFYQDMREHDRGEEVLLFIFSEFGRRARDNGGGTDHGTGGCCWIIGDHVKGGIYGEYPSLKQEDLEDGGDLMHNVDFRNVYATIVEKWLGMDSNPIIGGSFEQARLHRLAEGPRPHTPTDKAEGWTGAGRVWALMTTDRDHASSLPEQPKYHVGLAVGKQRPGKIVPVPSGLQHNLNER